MTFHGSRFLLIPGATHYVSSNNPNLFNGVVGKYLEDPYRGEEARR